MAVRSLKNSTLENFSNYSSSMNAGYDFNDFELIESVFVASPASSITFNNLDKYATEYKNLQIRSVARTDRPSEYADPLRVRINGDNGSTSYTRHQLEGTDAGVTSGGVADQPWMLGLGLAGGAANSSVFAASVIEFLDSYSTTKNKTGRALSGVMGIATGGNQNIRFSSGLWKSTAAINSINITATNNFQSGSRFSLYGIR
jgi:hypothetical protein